ncbi:MAG: sigma-54 dependent transcriptional regulator [Vicinamibacterales bacterium]
MLNASPRILAVDDDPTVLSLVTHLATAAGLEVATATTADEALTRLRERPADLVMLDIRLPGAQGLDLIAAVRALSPRTRVAVMTGSATIDGAVSAVKLGATDYLSKPFDLDRLRHLLRGVMDAPTLDAATFTSSGVFCGMVGDGSTMREIFSLLRRLAPHARTTLVAGETGTGKELAARALHLLGPRSHRRMVTVNCSAVVETLFESELFGHARGAFTGATEHKVGLFEAADGGTLFLDEVGELPAGAQAKLLRVLEDGEVQRVGSLDSRHVDVRVIAATNRDLLSEVEAGRFRSDLYYRLNVVQVVLPPLRDRREDIPGIARSFVEAFARKLGRRLAGLTPGAENLLREGAWDGNVRQLRNVLERACIMADGEQVTEADIASSMDRLTSGEEAARRANVVTMPVRPATKLDEVERDHIVKTLSQVHGNKAVAARLLGVSRRAFYRQLERHGLHHRTPASQAPRAAAPVSALGRAS